MIADCMAKRVRGDCTLMDRREDRPPYKVERSSQIQHLTPVRSTEHVLCLNLYRQGEADKRSTRNHLVVLLSTCRLICPVNMSAAPVVYRNWCLLQAVPLLLGA